MGEESACHRARLIGGSNNHGLGIFDREPVQILRNMQEVGQLQPRHLGHKSTSESDRSWLGPPPWPLLLYLHFLLACLVSCQRKRGARGRKGRGLEHSRESEAFAGSLFADWDV